MDVRERCPFCHVGMLDGGGLQRCGSCGVTMPALPTPQWAMWEKWEEVAKKQPVQDDAEQWRRAVYSDSYNLILAAMDAQVEEIAGLANATVLTSKYVEVRDEVIEWLTGEPFAWRTLKKLRRLVEDTSRTRPLSLEHLCGLLAYNTSAVREALLKKLTPALFVPLSYRSQKFRARIVPDYERKVYHAFMLHRGRTWEVCEAVTLEGALRFLRQAQWEIQKAEKEERRVLRERRNRASHGVTAIDAIDESISETVSE